jgi:hypothetical protein
MSTIPLIANRRRSGDRRRTERRQRNIPVPIERRCGQERRRSGERRQQDLYALANRLCAELDKVPADNPISRLLVVQQFLLDQRPRQEDAWIMKCARVLRDTYCDGDREGLCSAVFRALCGI